MINFFLKLYSFFTINEKRSFLFIILFLIIGMILEMIGVGLIFPVITILQNGKNNISYLNNFINLKNDSLILSSLILLVFFFLIKTLFVVFLTWKQNSFVGTFTYNISKLFFKHYILKDYKFHLNNNSSLLIRNIRDEPEALANILLAFFGFITESTTIFGIAILLLFFEPLGTIYLFLFFITCIFIFQKIVKTKIQYWGKKRQFFNLKRSQYLLEGFGAIKDIKILNKEHFFNHRFNQENFNYLNFNRLYQIYNQLPRIYLEFLSVLGLSILIYILTLSKQNYAEVLPIIGVFVASAFRMLPSINRIMSSMQAFKYFESSLDILFDEKKLLKDINIEDKVFKEYSFTEKISLNNIDFSFDGSSNRILKKINLQIHKGEYLGVIGTSGSGKSTLIDIILGLLTPNNGHICFDNFEIYKNTSDFKNSIGYVPQTIFLTDDTILNNIAFGLDPSQINIDKVNKIIKETQLDLLINDLKDGLNTFVGERGVRLSGGQRQRIGIARALYNSPHILILDEATSALDSDTESLILKEILQFKGNKTIIVIAHRLSTLSNCDRVIEISDGEIIKSGHPSLFLP